MEARDGIRGLVDWWFDRRSVEKVWPKEGPSTELAACLGSQRLRVQPSNPGLASWKVLHHAHGLQDKTPR